MSISLHPTVVVLTLPENVAELVSKADGVVSLMNANKATFPKPTPSLAQVTADIAALQDAQSAFMSRRGTRELRDELRKALVADLRQLQTCVQQLATADPEKAAVIAEQASMTLRRTGSRHKADLAIKQLIAGTILVIAKAIKGARAYEWQYSIDGKKTWLSIPVTTKASTAISGLAEGVRVFVQCRALTSKGLGDWSPQAASAVVS